MIHILIGPPCAGKSTYIREHAKDGDARVDFDSLAMALGAKHHIVEGFIKHLTHLARRAVIDEIVKNPDKESWIIDSRPSEENLKLYEKVGAEIIDLSCSKEECLERAESDDRPQETYEAIERYFAQEKGNTMSHQFKSFELKADENGTIEGYFSTYEKTPDSYGDIILPGAFTETIKKREATGHPFPLCFNHDFDKIIGVVDSIEEKEHGPYMKGHFLDTDLAQDVRKFIKSGAVYQFSFAYDVLEGRKPNSEEKSNGVLNVLTKLDVFEVSVVTVPANQNAVITDVKSDVPETKAGKRNSKSDEDIIRQIRDLANELLGEVEDKPEEEVEDQIEEVAPEVNEASEELKADDNLRKSADELLGKINSLKGDSEDES